MAVDLQPTLAGTLLELRPLRADDFAALFRAASDPLIWEQHPVKDRDREDVFREYFRGHLDAGSALVAIDRATREVVGVSRFHGYDEARSELEIGWTFLARSHWGGTVNRELKRLMLGHAFRFVDSVVFLVHRDNLRSRRSLEKLGAVRAGARLDGDGRPEPPRVAIVTASGSIDPAHPAVQAGALVLTTERGAARLDGRLPGGAQPVVLPGDREVDVRAAVEHLRSRGHERILTEGGPTLFGALAAAGLVDELFLTVSPLLAGRSAHDGRLGLVENTEILPGRRLAGELLSLRVHGAHLFLRYGFGSPAANA